MIFVHVWEVLEDHLLNPHHNGDICTTRKMTSSSYMGHDMKINEHFWIFGGPWQCLREDFNNEIGPISVHIYHLIYVNLHVKYGSNLIRTPLINPKYEKHGILSYLLGPEGSPYVESRGIRTKMVYWGKIRVDKPK